MRILSHSLHFILLQDWHHLLPVRRKGGQTNALRVLILFRCCFNRKRCRSSWCKLSWWASLLDNPPAAAHPVHGGIGVGVHLFMVRHWFYVFLFLALRFMQSTSNEFPMPIGLYKYLPCIHCFRAPIRPPFLRTK